jgi:hypothetical protein
MMSEPVVREKAAALKRGEARESARESEYVLGRAGALGRVGAREVSPAALLNAPVLTL